MNPFSTLSQIASQQVSYFFRSGSTAVNSLVSWVPILPSWLAADSGSDTFYLKAVRSETFQSYNQWRLDFHREVNQWLQQVIYFYRQGQWLYTEEVLTHLLLEQQVTFKPETHSALYYDRRLRVLAKDFRAYAHAVEGACHQFWQKLKNNPKQALQYFYYDVQYHLIQIAAHKVTLKRLQSAVSYYEKLVPFRLYQNVLAQLHNLKIQLDEANQSTFSNTVENLVKAALIAVEKNVATEADLIVQTDSSGVTDTRFAQAVTSACETNTWATLKKSVKASWNHFMMQPKRELFSAAGSMLVAYAIYRVFQEENNMTNLSISWLDTTILPVTSNIFPILPVTLNYLGREPALLQSASMREMSLPAIGCWILAELKPVAADSWAKIIYGSDQDYSYSIQQTADNGYILTGETYSFGAGGSDLLLSKWSENGALTWVKTLGGGGDDWGNSVQQTIDGGYIVCGGTTNFGAGKQDLWLSKWNPDGTLNWIKSLGGNDSDYGSTVWQTKDEGYIVSGSTKSFSAGDYDMWLSKWSENGTLTWVRTLGGNSTDYGFGIQQTTDEGYIVTGRTKSFGAGNYDMWLSKWSENGTLIWVRTLGGSEYDTSYALQQTADMGYIVNGQTVSFGAGNGDLMLSKWSENGNLTWVRTLGGNLADEGLGVQQTTDDGYITTGSTSSFDPGNRNIWLAKWTAEGDIIWVKFLNRTGTGYDEGYSVHQTTNDSYILSGYIYTGDSLDIFLSKLNNEGTIEETDCGLSITQLNNLFSTPALVNSTNIYLTPGTPSLLPQDVGVNPKTIIPIVENACKPIIPPPMTSSANGSIMAPLTIALTVGGSSDPPCGGYRSQLLVL